jgi:hypothetical protein
MLKNRVIYEGMRMGLYTAGVHAATRGANGK